MINYKKLKGENRIEVCYETGADYLYLQYIKEIINMRNKDKEIIIGLKEERM